MGTLQKANLTELKPDGSLGTPVHVQFNPLSLKVTYSNQLSSGDQAGGAPKQFVGSSTMKMTMELWFDTTDSQDDVRDRTRAIAYFVTPQPGRQEGKDVKIAPRVQFSWGSFLFKGIMDSMDENLEFWSEAGIPKRASATLSFSEQQVQPDQRPEASKAGQTPTAMPKTGETLQELVARERTGRRWQDVGQANEVDNPRSLAPGAPLLLPTPGLS
jgi:hypothetical protein